MFCSRMRQGISTEYLGHRRFSGPPRPRGVADLLRLCHGPIWGLISQTMVGEDTGGVYTSLV